MSKLGRRIAAMVGATALGAAGLMALAGPVSADGPTAFTNAGAISVPDVGVASPYPSAITVSGMAGAVSNVTASLNSLTHGSAGDLDVLLVAPDGSNLILMSDPGDGTSFSFANNATLTFSDAAASSLPASGNIPTGTYKPTNENPGGSPDSFPAPAPAASSNTTLSGAFTGVLPNGQWKLYVVDDVSGDLGSIAGGWTLNVTTTVAAAATSTTVSASPNPATVGQNVTLTATVISSGNPVTTGTVTFTDGPDTIAANVPLNGSGQATTTTSSLNERTHTITATYSGAAGFLSSNGSTTEVVDSPTVVTGSTFCNNGGLTLPSAGPATPYASHITVSGLSGTPTAVVASLQNVAHTVPVDLDAMLVGPGGQNVVLLSDVGGTSPVSGVNLGFADGQPAVSTTALPSGSYAPTNDATDGADSFPAPAPVPSGATAMSTFNSSSANGTWSLYLNDDALGDSGSVGAWCLTIASQAPSSTVVGVTPGRGPVGSTQTFTATVTSSGNPVTDGNVSFYDVTRGAHILLGTDALDGSGNAVLATTALGAGRHLVRAEYAGTSAFEPSTSSNVVVRIKPVADAGGPYTITEGDSLHLSAAGSSINATSKVRWDLNRDGNFSDAVGVSPTVTWSELQALGIQPGHTYKVVMKLKTNDVTARDRTTLTVVPA